MGLADKVKKEPVEPKRVLNSNPAQPNRWAIYGPHSSNPVYGPVSAQELVLAVSGQPQWVIKYLHEGEHIKWIWVEDKWVEPELATPLILDIDKAISKLHALRNQALSGGNVDHETIKQILEQL